jgi:hypothetical protein
MPALMASNNKQRNSASYSATTNSMGTMNDSRHDQHHVSFDLSRNSYHTLLSNKALKRMARSASDVSAITNTLSAASMTTATNSTPSSAHATINPSTITATPHSILKRRMNPHQSVELENVQLHRTLNMRPRELEAMASEMLLDNNPITVAATEPIPIRQKSGPIVLLSNRLAEMSLSTTAKASTTKSNNDHGSICKTISLDGDIIIHFPAKKKRRNRGAGKSNSANGCASANAASVTATMPTVMIN